MYQLPKLCLAVVTLGLAGSALCASDDKPHPFSVEVGLWKPTFSVSGLSKSTGVEIGLGYTFSQSKASPVSIGVESRGVSYDVSDDAGDSATFTLSEFLVNANYSPEGQDLFYGVHLGTGTASADIGGVTYTSSDIHILYGAQVGFNFSKTIYGQVRYTTSDVEGYKGISLGVGYRF